MDFHTVEVGPNAVARFVVSSATDSARIAPNVKECSLRKMKRMEPKYRIRNRQFPGSGPGFGYIQPSAKEAVARL
jgi:hypothetical protein